MVEQEDDDASGDFRRSLDEPGVLETEHHPMDRRRGDAEVALHVGFGRGLAKEDTRIDVDEGQVVALLLGEALGVWGGAEI